MVLGWGFLRGFFRQRRRKISYIARYGPDFPAALYQVLTV